VDSPLVLALSALDRDQLYVIVSIYWSHVSETEIAVELSELRGTDVCRDRVHRIRLTAEAKIRRILMARGMRAA
jgi:hypothetical protein